MQLLGYMDSPFVRRTAITAKLLGIDFVHREMSVFRDFDEFRKIQPMVKVPTLITDDGARLIDSTHIIRYLETMSERPNGLAPPAEMLTRDLQCTATAIAAMEKGAQLIYETKQRPEQLQHTPWKERLQQQLAGALSELEMFADKASPWVCGEVLTQSDISTAAAWGFLNRNVTGSFDAGAYPSTAGLSSRAESLPEFKACPIS